MKQIRPKPMSLKVNFTISTSDINFFKKPLLYSPQSWKANPNTKPLSWQVFTDSKIIFVLGSLSQNTTILAKNAGMLWRKQSKIPRDSWYKRKWVCFCCDKWQKKRRKEDRHYFSLTLDDLCLGESWTSFAGLKLGHTFASLSYFLLW